MRTIASDDFERGTLGSNWQILNGSIGIDGSNVYPNTATTEVAMRWVPLDFPASQWAEVEINPTGGSSVSCIGPAVRCAQTAANWYAFYADDAGSYFMGRVVAGVWTDISVGSRAFDPGDILRFEVEGSGPIVYLRGYVNGSMIVDTSDNSGSRLVSGYPGVAGYGQSSTNIIGRSWSGGILFEANQNRSIRPSLFTPGNVR